METKFDVDYTKGAWIPNLSDDKMAGYIQSVNINYVFTTNIDKIAETEYAIFAPSLEAVENQIEQLHSFDANLKTSELTKMNKGSSFGNRIYVHSNYRLYTDTRKLFSLDLDKLAHDVKYLKDIYLHLSDYNEVDDTPELLCFYKKCAEKGIIFPNNITYYSGHRISWDNSPTKRKAKRALANYRARQTRTKKALKQINIQTVNNFIYSLDIPYHHFPALREFVFPGKTTFTNAEHRICAALNLFNMVYGKNAHRRTSGFITFKNFWKTSNKRTYKKFTDKFIAWMNHELAGPNYKAKINDKPNQSLIGIRTDYGKST